jgi:transcriptional regulator with XRE-family HTH domain
MGSGRRARPARLPEKLSRIREAFGVTQEKLVKMLDAEELAPRNYISLFETGEREPPMPIVLKYARLAGVCMEVLVDDEMDLPNHIPANPPYHPAPVRARRKR